MPTSKESWLQDIADETMRYYKIDVTRYDCNVDGDRAVVKTTNVIEARIWGSHGTTYLRHAVTNTVGYAAILNNGWNRKGRYSFCLGL